jgi:hypothetical protein
MKKLFSILFLFISLAAIGQDVTIPLREFTLQIPTVNALVLRPIGAPFVAPNPADTTQKMLFQSIYYELRKADGKTVETGNKQIPTDLYLLVNKYITGTITAPEVAGINQFFQYADWPLTAILPE